MYLLRVIPEAALLLRSFYLYSWWELTDMTHGVKSNEFKTLDPCKKVFNVLIWPDTVTVYALLWLHKCYFVLASLSQLRLFFFLMERHFLLPRKRRYVKWSGYAKLRVVFITHINVLFYTRHLEVILAESEK